MNIRYFEGDVLSKTIYQIPLSLLLNSSEDISIMDVTGELKRIPKVDIVAESPETTKEIEFLTALYDFVKHSKSYLLICKLDKYSDKTFFMVDNIPQLLKIKYNVKTGSDTQYNYIKYIFSNLLEKIMVEDENWNYLFKLIQDEHDYSICFGKELTSSKHVKNFSKVFEFIEKKVKKINA